MNDRHDRDLATWPARPWIMAAICALAGLAVHLFIDPPGTGDPSAARQAGATFVVISALSLVLTVERSRWSWSLAFALGWGAVIAFVGWFTASYNRQSELAEFPFLSGIFAVLLAAPLFQTARDEGRWSFPYERLHRHAWTDAVIGAAALVFVGISFLLAWLIAGLFDIIGIDAVKRLLKEGWFGWMLAGFAFGAAVGLLRERDALVATLQRLVMVILSVLAPVLAVALLLFLASLPFTGLEKLWDSSVPSTPLMLVAGAGAVLLANAVMGNGGDDRSVNRLLRLAALGLVLCVLPLAIIAAVSLGLRIDQYGWTPERIWGVIAVLVATSYALVGWWSVIKGRRMFDNLLRPLQTRLAIVTCAIALFLALPILDFGAISARSQVDRLASGLTKPGEFDWRAMAFDFGPAGRARLGELARNGPADQRKLAAAALATDNGYDLQRQVEKDTSLANLNRNMRILPAGSVIEPRLREAIGGTYFCRGEPCVLILADARTAILTGRQMRDVSVSSERLVRQSEGKWAAESNMIRTLNSGPDGAVKRPAADTDMARATVELRNVSRRQLFVDGKPLGEAFE